MVTPVFLGSRCLQTGHTRDGAPRLALHAGGHQDAAALGAAAAHWTAAGGQGGSAAGAAASGACCCTCCNGGWRGCCSGGWQDGGAWGRPGAAGCGGCGSRPAAPSRLAQGCRSYRPYSRFAMRVGNLSKLLRKRRGRTTVGDPGTRSRHDFGAPICLLLAEADLHSLLLPCITAKEHVVASSLAAA